MVTTAIEEPPYPVLLSSASVIPSRNRGGCQPGTIFRVKRRVNWVKSPGLYHKVGFGQICRVYFLFFFPSTSNRYPTRRIVRR